MVSQQFNLSLVYEMRIDNNQRQNQGGVAVGPP
jgi:hypothetical protein